MFEGRGRERRWERGGEGGCASVSISASQIGEPFTRSQLNLLHISCLWWPCTWRAHHQVRLFLCRSAVRSGSEVQIQVHTYHKHRSAAGLCARGRSSHPGVPYLPQEAKWHRAISLPETHHLHRWSIWRNVGDLNVQNLDNASDNRLELPKVFEATPRKM